MIGDVCHAASVKAHDELTAKIEAGVREAFDAGMDFVHEPIKGDAPDIWGQSVFDPIRYTISVRGGPVPPGLTWNRDLTHYRRPDDWTPGQEFPRRD